MNLYDIDKKLDIIISKFNENYKEIIMIQCPRCTKKQSPFTEGQLVYMGGSRERSENMLFFKYESIFNNPIQAHMFFNSAMLNRCMGCQGKYYICFYFDEQCKGLTFSVEDFKKVISIYYVSSNLIPYLPTEELKRTYGDAKAITKDCNISSKTQMAVIRPLIEAFLNERNNVTENNNIREAISKLDDKGLEKQLHKIVDATLKGVHIKVIPLNNNPKEVILLLETLFNKLYKLPKEEAKIKEEYEQKKS